MNYGTKRIPRILTYLVLSLWALTTIYPFIWVALNSFRKKGLILSDSFSIPLGESFTWDNYITAWQRADFKNAYLNSFLISGTVTVFVVIIAGLAAYGLVRYRFRGRNLLYSLIMAGMMFPVFSTIIPVFRLEVMLGIAGTHAWHRRNRKPLAESAGSHPAADCREPLLCDHYPHGLYPVRAD